MNYQDFYNVFISIINHPLTHTLLIALVTVGVAWFAQSQERKKWEEQREKETSLWIYDKELIIIENRINDIVIILSNSQLLFESFTGKDISYRFYDNILIRFDEDIYNKYKSLDEDSNLSADDKFQEMMLYLGKKYKKLKSIKRLIIDDIKKKN